MFTGIITEIGTIRRIIKNEGLRAEIACPESASEISHGDSVSVDGICLTATQISSDSFVASISDETVRRSTFSTLKTGSAVNIELAMKADGRFGGHIVQGHVDGSGSLQTARQVKTGWEFSFSYPREIRDEIVEKGSIAVNGISLTIASLTELAFSVAVIPSTYEETTLKHLKRGDAVNLETDIIAKYVGKMLRRGKKSGISEEYLRQQGYFNEE